MPLSPTVLLSQATVLVVDDEESLRLYTSRVMEEAGYHVLTAGDGVQAMSVLQQSRLPVQLVITDVSMPRMTGPELAAHIAAERHGPPVLFISGGYSSDLPGPFLRKPFLPQQLSRLARRMLCGPLSSTLRLAHGECQEALMPALVSAGS